MKIVESIDCVGDAVDASESIIHVSLARRHVVRAFSPSTCPVFINVICQLKGVFFFSSPSIGTRSELPFTMNVFDLWSEIKITVRCS